MTSYIQRLYLYIQRLTILLQVYTDDFGDGDTRIGEETQLMIGTGKGRGKRNREGEKASVGRPGKRQGETVRASKVSVGRERNR